MAKFGIHHRVPIHAHQQKFAAIEERSEPSVRCLGVRQSLPKDTRERERAEPGSKFLDSPPSRKRSQEDKYPFAEDRFIIFLLILIISANF